MFEFTPKRTLKIKEDIFSQFPLPEDYAVKDFSAAEKVLQNLRQSGKESFITISDSELNWIYHLSLLCDDNEFEVFKKVYTDRVTFYSYKIGWIFFQLHPNEQRVKEIFKIACVWMNKNKSDEFKLTLPGRTGLPLEDIYMRSLEILKIEKSEYKDFCTKFKIIFDSEFSRQLLLTYISRCDKLEIEKKQDIFIKLIASASLSFLRPAIQNLTFKYKFDELSPSVLDAIINRLDKEKNEDNIGVSPQMLLRMRKLRFSSILDEFYDPDTPKYKIFKMLSGFIKTLSKLSDNTISIDFGSYIAVDSKDWAGCCYAYLPSYFAEVEKMYLEQGSPENFWPGIDKSQIPTAHDVILDIKHSPVILLEFSSFNMLFSRDLLLNGRILIEDKR